MSSNSKAEKLKDEVYLKIGRNIVEFQKMELLLKHIATHSDISGYSSELKSNQEIKNQKIQKQTMGHLVKQYLEKILSGREEIPELPNELKEPHLSLSIRIKPDENLYQKIKKDMESIVSERNELVHHLFAKFSSEADPVKKRSAIIDYLDKQNDVIREKIEALKGIAKTIDDLRKKTAEWLLSEDGEKFFNQFLDRGRPLISLLKKIEKEKSRNDGWIPLHTAGSIIGTEAPEELANMRKLYGHKKLKTFILSTGLFVLKEESTEKGGNRVLYRSISENMMN
jgi:hypothetical protein